MIVELLTVLAVLNATIPGQQIPIEVVPRLVDSEGDNTGQQQQQSSTEGEGGQAEPILGIDAGIITGIIALAGAMFAGYKKNLSRTDATADTSVNLAQSLKSTDIGVKDIANNLATALQKLSDANPQNAEALKACKEVAKENAEGWNQDVKEYYQNMPPPKTEDIGLDKVKTKLKSVNHITQPTPNDG